MLNGERFRAELEKAARDMAAGQYGGLVDRANAQRALLWADVGAEAIDDSDTGRATRFLLATIVNLLDQHMMFMHNFIWKCTNRILVPLLVPLWISALALLLIALKS